MGRHELHLWVQLGLRIAMFFAMSSTQWGTNSSQSLTLTEESDIRTS